MRSLLKLIQTSKIQANHARMKLKSITGSTFFFLSLLRKRETISPPGSALLQPTENTLLHHNLIYFVSPLASIISNMHPCPCFLVREGEEEREERQRYTKGQNATAVGKLLKNENPTSFLFPEARMHTIHLRKCILGMDTRSFALQKLLPFFCYTLPKIRLKLSS